MKNHRSYIDYIRNLSRMQKKPEKIQAWTGFEVIRPLNYASVNSTCAQPPTPPGLLRGICPPCHFPGPFPSFLHARGFLSEYTYTEGFTEKKKEIGSSVRDRNKLKRVVKASSRFYVCISSLLIKPELQSENWSYRCESTLFGYWIKFLLILFEEHTFIFIYGACRRGVKS